MRDRRKQGTVGWLIIFCALLAWLVIMVDCRKLRAPGRRKQKVVRDKIRQKPQLRQYHSEEYEGFIDPLEDYAAFDEYHDDAEELVSSQKLPEQTVGGYYKPYKQPPVKYIQPVYIQPKKPLPKPTTSVIREVHHIPMSGHKHAGVGLAFASGIKYIVLTLLALKAAIVALTFLLLPLKLLIGLKLFFIANVFVFGVLAAKLKSDKYQYWSTVTPAPVVVTPASTSSLSTNSQLSISQPVTTVIHTPTQQEQQQQAPWNYSYNWPWPFYNSQCPACNLKPPNPSFSNIGSKHKIPIIIHIPNKDTTDNDEDDDYSFDLFKTPQKQKHAVVPKIYDSETKLSRSKA